MRNIFFRAWDKANKKMHYSIECASEENDFDDYTSFAQMLESVDDLVIMQSTCMYDKNEEEIFEHDIVKYKDDLFSVIYKEKQGMFVACGIEKDLELTFREIDSEECEIAGNIWENKEMICKMTQLDTV